MKSALVQVGLAALLASATPGVSAERVQIAVPGGTALTAHWMPRPDGGRAPAVVALHGCSGLYERRGTAFDPRYPDYVERLHRAGFHVLLPDSFGSRGYRSICTIAAGQRTITVETRRDDAIAAVAWLAQRADVDPQRIALLGWSNGATTTLSALNAARTTRAQPVAAAIVFYPGCSAFVKRRFQLETPLLMLLGEKDDWTPPARCLELAERTRAHRPDIDLTVRVFPDSHHGFDTQRPVRFRADVPAGPDGKGVHVGGNAASRAAALGDVEAFLAAHLGAGRVPAAASAAPPR